MSRRLGVPIEQAKRAVEACLGTLGEQDRFGFVAFDDKLELFRSELAPGTLKNILKQARLKK